MILSVYICKMCITSLYFVIFDHVSFVDGCMQLLKVLYLLLDGELMWWFPISAVEHSY